jgi:ferredoxin-NADP reductase
VSGPDPLEHGWWLASRSAGVVALLCISLSVAIGLAMAGRTAPGRARTLLAIHQQTALAGLIAIAVHGITLLGDAFMDPGLVGISVPFVIDHEPVWTGLGVTGGWLAAILGLSYWLRDRIGPARWRRLHKATLLVYLLSVAHTLGSGTDGSEPWMRVLLVVTGAPILFGFLLRVLPAPRADDGFRELRVAQVTPESSDVTSFALEPVDEAPLAPYAPGQFLTLRLGGDVRSYSLSTAHDPRRHRISVKRDGVVSTRLHALEAGDIVEATAPAGAFVLDEDAARPVVLLSAGIGATPVLAMLAQLARERTTRDVWWIHGARCGREHAFREEVRELVAQLPNGRMHVAYSRPDPRDERGRDFHAAGRLGVDAVLALGVPTHAAFHLCGTRGFAAALHEGLTAAGAEHVRAEAFGGPAGPAAPSVAFSKSGVTATWDGSFPSLLDLAEAHDVKAPSGCRIGACHSCRASVLTGTVRHDPEPLQPPPDGCALLCCARPEGDVVLDA